MTYQRIGRFLDYLKVQIYPDSEAIEDVRFIKTQERFHDTAQLDVSGWEQMDRSTLWGGHREYYWFAMRVTVPERFEGKCVCYDLLTGKEDGWDATNPQFTCYVDGVLRQGFDVNHHTLLLTEKAAAGEQHTIVLSAYTGDQNFSLFFDARLLVLDRATEAYYYDLSVPYHAAELLDENSDVRIQTLSAINASMNLVDMRREGSAEYYESLRAADAYFQKEFYDRYCGTEQKPVICCVGHSHIDCAWMWTTRVTRDKAVRSFSTVLELMRQYPEYRFMMSQPLLYEYVRDNAPEVYAEIKERVREGRWEAEGGMYIEPDCNLSSGESLIRQILYGKRFFAEEFGKDSIVLWLPDVFGYSAALPQIMKKTGIKYFMTTKISWNEFNRMPYDTFLWRGIDGTEILTHFMPTRDYKEGQEINKRAKVYRTNFFTTYSGYINPSQVMGSWKRYSQKQLNQETLMAFGYGDGGGGPTRDMLEQQRRLSRGLPGSPATKMTTVTEFFQHLEQEVTQAKELPTWVGELYLEYHRGTYTTMGRNKRYNRKSEIAYQNLERLYVQQELLGRCGLTGGEEQPHNLPYPRALLDQGWHVIMLNQFHDILPGSSIKEVYEDSRVEYEEILQTAKELYAKGFQSFAAQLPVPDGSVVVRNEYGQPVSGPVTLELEKERGALGLRAMTDGRWTQLQRTHEGAYLFEAEEVPGVGYRCYQVSCQEESPAANPLRISEGEMENAFFRLLLDENGQFVSIYDKRAEREILKPGRRGNVLMTYEDRPHNYDAWDINDYYEEKSWEIRDAESIRVLEHGPVRGAVEIRRRYLDSEITQIIYLYAATPRIDIRTTIDWREHLILLKDQMLPVDVNTDHGTFEIQYGNVERPIHANTSWDYAQFEVCSHKWFDLSEGGYGISFLNDCKYGASVRNAEVGLTMLKSPLYPNPEADKEHHEIWYSIYPHEGDWREAGTVPQAYNLNNPLRAGVKESRTGGETREQSGTIPGAEGSLFSIEDSNIVLEVVKKAEDGEGIILRLYECYNNRTRTALHCGFAPEEAWECDMLENRESCCSCAGKDVLLEFKPYEIKTLRLMCRGE